MNEYDLLQFVNKTLQGNFSKYPLLVARVASLCCSESSFDEASQKFQRINAAIARIGKPESPEEDVKKLEAKLNALIDFQQVWNESEEIKFCTKKL